MQSHHGMAAHFGSWAAVRPLRGAGQGQGERFGGVDRKKFHGQHRRWRRCVVKSLPDNFRSDGFDFSVLNREGNVALLAKSKPGGVTSYEVVVIQHRPAEVICGQPYPAREAMPRSEEWGVAGWSYCDRDQAD